MGDNVYTQAVHKVAPARIESLNNLSDTVTKLRTLAARARRNDLPGRNELAAVALDLAADAREHVREYVNKHGEKDSYKDPNYGAANKGVEVAAALLLPAKSVAQPLDADLSKLTELGWRVVPKPNGGFELDPVVPDVGERH